MRATRFTSIVVLAAGVAALGSLAAQASASQYFFSTGNPDAKIAGASRPASSGTAEIEAADDFVVDAPTALRGGTFVGLLPSGASLTTIQQVRVEIYRVFPSDSDLGRTSGAPTFSTALVPTRVNSPSDVAAASRTSQDGGLSFTPSLVSPSFTTANSVVNGIHPKPNTLTGGDGAASGEEVSFNVQFDKAVNVEAGHYFLVPQVALSSGVFLWLSAPKPIVPPGTPFPAGATDLQSWARNDSLDPDWLRVGTDIVGAGTFNGAFSLSGTICSSISVTPAAIPSAVVGEAYTTSFTAAGGGAPYGFTESGALPAGLKLSGGVLSGTPTQSGSFPLTIEAADASGCTGTVRATLAVAAASPPPTGPTGPAGPVLLTGPPRITGARLSHTAFRAAARRATLAAKRTTPTGSTVTYRDDQAATTTVTVLRRVAGRRSGARCVAGALPRQRKRCTRTVVIGSATHVDTAGNVKLRFSGRVRGRKLAAGAYVLTLTPKSTGGTGRTVTLRFRIVSPAGR